MQKLVVFYLECKRGPTHNDILNTSQNPVVEEKRLERTARIMCIIGYT